MYFLVKKFLKVDLPSDFAAALAVALSSLFCICIEGCAVTIVDVTLRFLLLVAGKKTERRYIFQHD